MGFGFRCFEMGQTTTTTKTTTTTTAGAHGGSVVTALALREEGCGFDPHAAVRWPPGDYRLPRGGRVRKW